MYTISTEATFKDNINTWPAFININTYHISNQDARNRTRFAYAMWYTAIGMVYPKVSLKMIPFVIST